MAVDAVKESMDSFHEFSLLEETGQVELQEYGNINADTRCTVSCFWIIGYPDVIFVALRKSQNAFFRCFEALYFEFVHFHPQKCPFLHD